VSAGASSSTQRGAGMKIEEIAGTGPVHAAKLGGAGVPTVPG
jgi:hypothetical protein